MINKQLGITIKSPREMDLMRQAGQIVAKTKLVVKDNVSFFDSLGKPEPQRDISRERIRQIENKAFEKLQKHMLLLAKSKNLLPAN